MRDAHTQKETSELIKLVARLVQQLDTDLDSWQVVLDSVTQDLHHLTISALNSRDGLTGLDSHSYRVRAQELAIRIDILEELIAQLPDQQLIETEE